MMSKSTTPNWIIGFLVAASNTVLNSFLALFFLAVSLAYAETPEADIVPPPNLKETALEFFTLHGEKDISSRDQLEIRRFLMNVRRGLWQDIPYLPEEKIEGL